MKYRTEFIITLVFLFFLSLVIGGIHSDSRKYDLRIAELNCEGK